MKSLKNILEDALLGDIQEPNGFCMLKPGFCDHSDEFIGLLGANGWKVLKKTNRKFSEDTIKELYSMHKDKPFYNDLCKYMSSDKCCCFSCYKKCKNPIEDMNKIKEKIRKQWGKDEMHNAMHSSDSLKNVKRESSIMFND